MRPAQQGLPFIECVSWLLVQHVQLLFSTRRAFPFSECNTTDVSCFVQAINLQNQNLHVTVSIYFLKLVLYRDCN